MGHGMGLGDLIPVVGFRGNSQKLLLFWDIENLKIANSGLFYTRRVTQNKEIATSKDTVKDCQPEEKFCCLKIKLTHPDKHKKLIFLRFSFLKNEECSFFSFKYDIKYLLCQ